MSKNLTQIEAARRKVAMLEKDCLRQDRHLELYKIKLQNTKEDLEIAKRDLAELEKPQTPPTSPNQ